MEWVTNFLLEFHFEQEKDKSLHHWVGIGKPYILYVLIESDVGRIYKYSAGGYCRPHDPKWETRRKDF